MKTITRTFYIDQGFFLMLLSSHKNHCEFQKDLAQFFLKNHNGKLREIQISWQEPDTKYELTVDEIFNLCSDWIHDSAVPSKFKEYVKKKLGDR